MPLQYARLNAFRLNNSRLNYIQIPKPQTGIDLWVNGAWVDYSASALVEGATVTQALNEVPDTATIRFKGSVGQPLKGQRIRFRQNNPYAPPVDFAGHILAVRTVYEGLAKNVAYECDCIDFTWTLNFHKVTYRYTGATVGAIVASLVTTWGQPGFTTAIDPLVPATVIDEITFTNEDVAQAISRTCERLGLYWLVDYDEVVRVFTSAAIASAGTITQTDARTSRNLTRHEDLSPIANVVRARGGGAGVASDVAPGATTIPVEDPTWYVGGQAIECGPQVINYASVSNPETGSLVGAGNAPDAPPTVAARAGNNLAQGYTYGYAVTFVTAAGESLPGPVVGYYVAGATIPSPVPPTVEIDYYSGSKVQVGGTYRWALELLLKGGQKIGGQPSAPITVPAGDGGLPKYVRVSWSSAVFNDPAIQGVYVHRTLNNGGTFYFDTSGLYNSQGYWQSSPVYDVDLPQMGAMAPTSGVGLLSATLSNIPTRPGVTGRKIYRTTANGSQLKLLGTINDNSTTTFIDTITDAGLGANAPVADTSGLKTDGQIPAGSASILVASVGVFAAAGGWVRVGNMLLKYTGVSGSSLVLAEPLPSTLSYGSEIVNAPYLVGIPASASYGSGGILYPIKRGDDAYITTTRWDQVAIDNLKAWIGYGDGQKDEFLTDGRLSLQELTARADAMLAYRKDALVTVTFQTRDPNVTVGRTITFNTTSPPIVGTFLIQRVSIADFPARAHVKPVPALRTVEASSRRYTFEDLVQQIKLLGRIN